MREGGGRTQWNRSRPAEPAPGAGVDVAAEAAVLGRHGAKTHRGAKEQHLVERADAEQVPLLMDATWWPGSDDMLLVVQIGDAALADATPSGLLHRHPDLFGFELWNADHKEAPWNEDVIISRGRAQLCLWIRGRRWSHCPIPVAETWKSATNCLVGVACGLDTVTAATSDLGERFVTLLELGQAVIAQAEVVPETRNRIALARTAA